MDAKVELRPAPASPERVRETDDSFLKDVEDAGKAEAAARAKDREGRGTEDNAEDTASFLQLARERAQIAQDAWQPIHEAFRRDIEFRSGQQWPAEIENQRSDRVRLTLNQLPKFIRQVLNDGKQNRISIKVSPMEGNAASLTLKNRAGTNDYTLAEAMQGIVQNIEVQSKASIAYDRALEHCVEGSFGWLKVEKRLSRPDGFEQELVIRAKRNPYSVLYDPQAMLSDEPNFQGGMYCFEQIEMPRKDAEKKYPGVTDFDLLPESSVPWWGTSDTVRIARYWYVEIEQVKYVLLSNGSVMEGKEYEEAAPQLQQSGVTVVQEREGEKRCVYWADIDGHALLSSRTKWDGGYIPVVPVLGPELMLDGKVVYESLIRHSHDAQRMYNYWRSAATEAVALAPKAPWLAADVTVAGYEKDYEQATEEPTQLLKYKHRENVPPPQRVQSANNPAAEIQQSLQANDDIKGTLGLFDASIGSRSNETSGIAIQRRQQEGDTGTYNWHDSLATAIGHVGVILVDLIPKVYDTERMMRIRTPDDGEDFVAINYVVKGPDGQPYRKPDGKPLTADLGLQRYDVAVSTGPAVTTQRLAAAEAQMEFMGIAAKVSPQHAAAILDKVAAGMDWQNADAIAKRLRKMLPPDLLEPDEQAELQGDQPDEESQGPSPEEQAQAAQQELAGKKIEAEKITAEAALLTAQAKLAEAQALSPENVKELVAQAIAELMSGDAPPPPTNPLDQPTY